MNENTIRILICDDHALFRSGVISILKEDPNIFIVGEAEDGLMMIQKYFQLKPDVVLADISMPKLSGTEALKEIKRKDPCAKVLFLTMLDDEQYIYYCLKAGGLGLLSKNSVKGELMYAIKEVYSSRYYFGPSYDKIKLDEVLIQNERNIGKFSNNEPLSDREEQILDFISQGLMSQEIAEKLCLSKRTVDTHRQNIMQKHNLKNLPSLLKFAIEYTSVKK